MSIKEKPVIQRTPDRIYSHINEHCYKWSHNGAIEITDKEFKATTENKKLETCDLDLDDILGEQIWNNV